MTSRIIRIETFGMKGIEKLITFQFLNDTINYSSVDAKSTVKAIYGMNGSGKSSFISAVDVYKHICESGSYLNEESTVKTLNKLINKKTHKFYFKVFFSNIENRVTYCHEILINNETLKPFIEKECLSVVAGKTINDELRPVIEMEMGGLVSYSSKVIEAAADSKFKNVIEKTSQYSSFSSILWDVNFRKTLQDVLPKEKFDFVAESPIWSLSVLQSFVSQISVFLDNEDRQREIDSDSYSFISELFNLEMSDNPIIRGEDGVPIRMFEAYEKGVSRMASFIKLFKPQLRGISIEKRINENLYYCKLNMDYDDYSIDSKYESTGIKNLMAMFVALENASRGGISFIDEMDANMNEVYLSKLCEYFTNYSSGQLCFTTHNTAPMKILKKSRFGIDFINGNGECVSWKRNGNYSPTRIYSEGMIHGIPFNIEDFDFADVFLPSGE